MARATATPVSSDPIVEHDRLGERRHSTAASGDAITSLCVRADLATVPAFEFVVRERVARLAGFRHPAFVHVRGIERLSEPRAPLAIVSDRASGTRLSDLLARIDPDECPLDITSALRVTRQLAAALAALHGHARGVTHGAVAPERLILTPNTRLLVMDYALGSALERLEFSIDRYWTDLRVALPPHVDPPRINERVDVLQMGLVALALILGRPLTDEDFPARVPELVASAWAVSSRGGLEPLPSGVRRWLVSALQLDPRASFASVEDARAELDTVVSTSDIASSSNLEMLLAPIDPVLTPPRIDDDAAEIIEIVDMGETRETPKPGAPPTAPPPSLEPPAPPAREPEHHRERNTRSDAPSADVAPLDAGTALTDSGEAVGVSIPDRRPWIAAAAVAGVLALSGAWAWTSLTAGPWPTVDVPASARDGSLDPAGAIDFPPAGTAGQIAPAPAGLVLAGLAARGSAQTTPAIPAPLAPAPTATPRAGWITITSPIRLDVMANGSLIGSDANERISITAGQHEIELVNDALGFRARQTVSVPAGGAAAVTVAVPTGTLSINAEPWAEVWIRGEHAGDTPLANLSLPIGAHQIVLRHPELGERVHEVTVSLKEAARLSVDLRTPR